MLALPKQVLQQSTCSCRITECSNECHRVKDLQKEGNEVCPAEDCEPTDNHSLASGIVFEFVGAAKSRLGNHCVMKRCGGECT